MFSGFMDLIELTNLLRIRQAFVTVFRFKLYLGRFLIGPGRLPTVLNFLFAVPSASRFLLKKCALTCAGSGAMISASVVSLHI